MARGRGSGQPTRRNTELALLLLVFAVGGFAAWQVAVVSAPRNPENFWFYAGLVPAGYLAAHMAIRKLAPYADPFMLPAVALLNELGMAMIYRLDNRNVAKALANGDPVPSPVVHSQVTWLVLGIIAFIVVLLVVRDHRKLQRYIFLSALASLILLVLPLVPGLGTTINGATLWIRIGPFSLQPAEFAKVLVPIFFAGWLVQKRDALAVVHTRFLGLGWPRPQDYGPILVMWGLCMLILVIFETDLGTALMFFGLFVGMLYVATARRTWVVLGAILVVIGGTLGYMLFSHVRVRVKVWLDPFAYANDMGYQLVQAIYGFAHGGLFGTGWGSGYPYMVPYANSDFIFASLGEEIGLIGCAAILALFAVFIQRGLRTAVASRDAFGTLLATGYSIVFGLQCFVVMGGVTGLIPLTGLTTPFMSAGGSSLLANFMILAVLMRISNLARRPDPEPIQLEDANTEIIRRVPSP